ncbi:MAG: MiaB/RimO family radical SAM methylthiotransferase [Desulfovibrio sp.]
MQNEKRRMFAATLGCKINQYETQAIAEAWRGGGWESAESAAEADVILVNSCAVTAKAVADLRKTVRRLNRENPDAGIIVTGCAAQILREELAELPGVVRVVPQEDKAELLRPHAASFSISDYPRARAVVMVQDGCSHGCTYCIVPLTRGPSRSREPSEILDEAEQLLDKGFHELILSGVNLRQFGRDLAPGPLGNALDFWDLLCLLEERLARFAGRARLRLSSVEPGQLGDKALEVLGGSRLACPHLHLSLQAGDPEVLRRMGRGHYRAEQAEDFLEKLAASWPIFGLGADLLTGFPGETEAQFENTLDFCRRLPLSYAHVFPYSSRPGTPAARMKDKVPAEEKKRRAALLRGLADEKKSAFLQRVAGLERVDVLVQDTRGNGVCAQYAPCRFTRPGPGIVARKLVPARPVGVRRGVVLVEPLEGFD